MDEKLNKSIKARKILIKYLIQVGKAFLNNRLLIIKTQESSMLIQIMQNPSIS